MKETNMFPLEIGDVVTTTGGGPNMTIEGTTNNGKFMCGWFVNGHKKEAPFDGNALTTVYQEPTLQDMKNLQTNR